MAPMAAGMLAVPALAVSMGLASATEMSRPAGDRPPIRGSLTVDGKQIPLPDGEWRVAGQAVFTPAGRPAPETVTSLSLVRLRGDAVTAAVLIQVATPGTDTAWGKAAGCERTDLPLARVRYASDHDGSCAWVASVVASVEPNGGDAPDPAWKQTLATAERAGWAIPESWAVANIRVTDPRDAIQVRYAFDGGRPPGPGTTTAITTGTAPAVAPALPGIDWVENAWNRVESGFRGRLDANSVLPDWSAQATRPPAKDDAQESTGFSRTVWKTVTFRTVVTTLDFSTNYIAIGNAATAAGLSAFAFVVGPFVYLGHEMAWEKFGNPALPSVELPGFGTEGPSPL